MTKNASEYDFPIGLVQGLWVRVFAKSQISRKIETAAISVFRRKNRDSDRLVTHCRIASRKLGLILGFLSLESASTLKLKTTSAGPFVEFRARWFRGHIGWFSVEWILKFFQKSSRKISLGRARNYLGQPTAGRSRIAALEPHNFRFSSNKFFC